MNILAACREGMIAQAKKDSPNETCGLFTGQPFDRLRAQPFDRLGARPGLIERIHPLANVSQDPRVRYEFAPVEHFKILKKMEKEGVPILGVYHSHPASEAYPSVTDVGRAILPDGSDPLYPDYLYIIISLQHSGSPVVRGFRILSGGHIREEELIVVDP